MSRSLETIGQVVRRLRPGNTQPTPAEPFEEGCIRLEGYKPTFSPATTKQRCRELAGSKLRSVIRDVINARSPWPLHIHGEVGSGKSCAALCMIDAFGGWYIKLADMCDLLIDAKQGHLTWSNGMQRTSVDVWQAWEQAHLCVLDEVATRGSPSDFYRETFQKCVDQREDKPLVVISNCDLDELVILTDDRIASRLSSGTRVRLKGDRRVAKGFGHVTVCER